MSALELVTEHLDLWTEALTKKSSSGRGSNGKVHLTGVKKLRELILELAVRGMLVHQSSSDKPSSNLIADIEADKSRLVASKAIKKPNEIPKVSEANYPFSIPENWSWHALGALGYTQTGSTPAKSRSEYFGSAIPFLKPGDISEDGSVCYENEGLTHAGKAALGKWAERDSILMVCIGTIGKCGLIERQCTFNQQINSITPNIPETSPFLLLCMKSPYFQKAAWEKSSSTTISILNKGKWQSIPVPLPPLEEQHRIVQKVDELMALCDRLEQQTSDQLEAHEILVGTLLGTLTQSKNAAELADNWVRLAAHFDALFTTEQSIDKLKQTILQLAVMGRLVEQDPRDEPATVLLEKISKLKAEVPSAARTSTVSSVTDIEQPFPQPSGWLFKRLGDLAHVFAGNSFKSQDFNNLSGSRVIKITNVGVGELVETQDFLPPEFTNEYKKYQVLTGDLILALTRPYISTGLKVAVCPEAYNQALLNQRVAAIRPFVDQSFLYIYMQSKYVLGLYQARFGGSGLQPNLKMNDVTNLIIPVPPFAEQHRIVQKVDELMTLCDQLKDRLNHASETRCQLAEAIVEQGLSA